MTWSLRLICSLLLAIMPAAPGVAADNKSAVYDDPAGAAKDSDFAVQGEYAHDLEVDGQTVKIGAQVIALGNGKFKAFAFPKGLPGEAKGELKKVVLEVKNTDAGIELSEKQTRAVVKDGVITIYDKASGNQGGQLTKVTRESPTLGAKPPVGAVILFDGKTNGFKDGEKKVTKDGLLMQGLTSTATFGDFTLHVEFRLPFQPGASGQGRGNSGVYMQGRYEVQVLDSFGLEGRDNECGGIYSVKAPDLNMCFPPLTWQTYDIDFTAARFDAAGRKSANARMTVKHNGVVIHKDVEVPKSTTAAPKGEGKDNGPIYIQDHGNPVRYRNIWLVEKK